MISANLAAIFYLVSGILFILALRGLSSPDTSRQGNYFGIAGMIIAIVVTFLSIGNFSTSLVYVVIFLVIGGAIGAFIAFKIPMTAMPELVAGFHSLVGLAAVFVAISAFLNPEAFNLGIPGNIKLGSLIEMSIGAAVGAITFSGSVIAFLKLQGIMSGSPITFKGQHPLNAIILISIVFPAPMTNSSIELSVLGNLSFNVNSSPSRFEDELFLSILTVSTFLVDLVCRVLRVFTIAVCK